MKNVLFLLSNIPPDKTFKLHVFKCINRHNKRNISNIENIRVFIVYLLNHIFDYY